MDHPYCYPGTQVYRNKLGIRDADLLASFERLESLTRMESLPRDAPLGVAGYRSIHRYLFENIYDWAGEFAASIRAGRAILFAGLTISTPK